MTTLAAFIDIGIYLLFALLIIVALLLLVVILMQRPKQEGLGAAFGAALTDQAFGARTTDVLKKGTVYLGTIFMCSVLVLAILLNKKYNDETKGGTLGVPAATAEQSTAPEAGTQEQAPAETPAPAKTVEEQIREAQEREGTETPAPAEDSGETPEQPQS